MLMADKYRFVGKDEMGINTYEKIKEEEQKDDDREDTTKD